MKSVVVLFAILPIVAWAAPFVVSSSSSATCGDAFASWDATELRVGNAMFTASFRMRGGVLKTASFKAGGRESLRIDEVSEGDEIVVTETEPGWSAAGERELALVVASGGASATVRVWPKASGPMVECQPAATPLPKRPGEKAWGSGVFSFSWRRLSQLDKCGDALSFAAKHMVVRAYTPIDRTDLRAELLDVREFEMPTCEAMAYLRCGVLDVRETLAGRGIVFLRLAPMPVSRTDHEVFDFVVSPATCAVMAVPNGYPLAMLAYDGGETGRIRALRDFHRSLWPYRHGRDGQLVSNTWGDGNRDSRINEDFLMKEIAAAADIGVDVVQIDDGWQKGRSVNSSKGGGKGVWNGYWAADPHFWDPDPVRFPNGLAPLSKVAVGNGLSLGFWFGPDSSDEAANWERDADCLIGMWRDYGARHFKIDSLKLHTPKAFARNRRFFEKMLGESSGEMCFDLDCTAEVRPGFLGGMPVGQLFAENRYAFRKGDRRVYYPHQTLRSLWSLAHVIDPMRLRMEFLNPAKNDTAYGDDPLRPAAWPADALFAISMLSSPLAWMELSDVPEEVRAKWRPLIAAWKRERGRLHGGVTVPVGSKPDGEAWTGFVTVCDDGGGYALIFREMNVSSSWRLGLREYFRHTNLSAKVLSGEGAVAVPDGVLCADIPHKLGYVWVSLSK